MMESIDTLLIVLLSVAIMIVAAACVVILSRSRKAQSTAGEARRKPAGEELRRDAEQEAVRRAEKEERQRAKAEKFGEDDEVKPKKEQLQASNENRCKGNDERNLLEDKKDHKSEKIRSDIEIERKRLEPVKRGGRPRGFNRERERQLAQETTPRCPRPEIICWKKERQWMAAVEISEEFLEKSGLTVLQDGLPLTREESREACWSLERVFGEVVVQWNEGEAVQETRAVLGQDVYLLFKLSGQDQNQGRHVKSPSSGSYLVMAPDHWKRNCKLSGPPPVKPEPVFLPGYQAHFFELEKDGGRKIAFLTSKLFVIESKAPQFELVGNRLNDASEDKGPLFGEAPPRIRALDEQGWKNVGTIVVGEEGMGKKRLRTHFAPNSEGQEQDLPSKVAARKGGWYFVRLYDTKDDLLESLDFRFLCALKEIRLLQPFPLPLEDGHRLVRVEFLHESGCAVQSIDALAKIQIERQDDRTILTIPPDPTYDETPWLVGSEGGPQVEVTILVERLWWGIGEEHNAPSEWRDQPFTLLREDFAATSTKALWLRLPRRRWVDKVLVGFEQSKARPYDVKVTEKTIAVPLREFGDSKEVGDRTQEYPLKVWIERDGKFMMEKAVAAIPASVVAPERGQVVSSSTARRVGLGRKKTVVAEAVLRYGSAKIEVNGHPLDEYFKGTPSKAKCFLYRLFKLDPVHEALSQMEVRITVAGSSPSTMRQAKAVAHAIARALMSYDPKLKPLLRQAGFGGVRVKKTASVQREE